LQNFWKEYNEFILKINLQNMTTLNVEAFKEAWLSFEEIESIKQWLDDVENWRIYTEEEFYSRLEKSLFSNFRVNV
jgi:hypothetical protein